MRHPGDNTAPGIGVSITPDEWRRYVGDEPYRETCPGVPTPPS